MYFWGDKIRNTSFEGRVKPAVPCRKIFKDVEYPYSVKELAMLLILVSELV
jgi:hypothetical protein